MDMQVFRLTTALDNPLIHSPAWWEGGSHRTFRKTRHLGEQMKTWGREYPPSRPGSLPMGACTEYGSWVLKFWMDTMSRS